MATTTAPYAWSGGSLVRRLMRDPLGLFAIVFAVALLAVFVVFPVLRVLAQPGLTEWWRLVADPRWLRLGGNTLLIAALCGRTLVHPALRAARPATLLAQDVHGVPGVRPVPPHDRLRQRGVRVALAPAHTNGPHRQGPPYPGAHAARRPGSAVPARVVWRTTAAGRSRPIARGRTRGAADGRAALQPRREAAGGTRFGWGPSGFRSPRPGRPREPAKTSSWRSGPRRSGWD